MKIAIISDLHLGFRQYGSLERENDFYNQLSLVKDEINKHNPDMLIIAGDLFDKPNPSPVAINAYREGIANIDVDIICSIKGNHTMILRDNHYSIDDFFGGEDIYGYYFLDDSSFNTQSFALETPYDLDFSNYKDVKVQVDGITYRTNSNIEEFLSVQKDMAEQCSKDFFNILVVHQSFKEFCGFTGEELSIEDLNYKPYDVVICGHIHSRFDTVLSDGTIFIQPGSIERMNTTEAQDEQKNGKGFYLLDTESKEVSFHQVKCPRKFFLGEIKIESKKDLEKHLKELQNDTKKLDVAPIISYTYKNYDKNIDSIREEITHLKENILLNNSNIDDESQEDISIEITDTEIPTVLESIMKYGEKSGLSKKECRLAVDLHQALNMDSESVNGLLENYFEKNKKHFEEEEIIKEDDLKEFIEYFGE